MTARQPFENMERIEAALAYTPADDRAVWYRMGMAIKSELGEAGFALWDTWSQTADSYNAKAAKSVWKGIKETGGITIASLFHEAMQHGYKPVTPFTPPTPEQRARLDAERAVAQRLADEDLRQQREAAKANAVKLWETAGPVLASHSYVVAKGVKPVGAKQLRQMLVLPLRVGGELVNLQFIGEDGSKRFCSSGQVKGTSLILGQLRGASVALLCEGWATGCSLHEATGLPVIVGWNAGNLAIVAERLAKVEGLALVVAGDSDASGTGQQAAIHAARTHGNARWCIPAFTSAQRQQWADAGKGMPSDFNDLAILLKLFPLEDIDTPELERGLPIPDDWKSVLTRQTEAAIAPEIAGVTVSGGNSGNTGNKNEESSIGTGCGDAEPFPPDENAMGTHGNKQPAFFVSTGSGALTAGVYWLPPSDGDKESLPVWLCSPLLVLAETRDDQQSNWGRLLQWLDNDNHVHTWACPADLLASSDQSEFRKELARQGLTISTAQRARARLADYVLTYPPDSAGRVRCVTRIGWHGNRYVLPGDVYGKQDGEGVIYQGSANSDFAAAGTLDGWRSGVAAMAIGNSRMMFALSVAFAGVLAEMAGESGGGFHFVGTTSKGKTSTLLDPAASVWGNPERFSKKWRATTNGLEATCSSRNDNLLILDELAQISPQEAGGAAYLIANGQAKARMTKEGGQRDLKTWRTMLLSAGEISLAEHMAEAGKVAKGGQMARLPAIPADAGVTLGTLEQLHHHATGQAFADHLKESTRLHYGHAGAAFLAALTANDELERIRVGIRADLVQLGAMLDVPAGAAQEVGRVASRFALVALAGELATQYGVTGWQPREAFNAAKQCFSAWLAEAGGATGADHRALFQQVGGFMQQNSSTRFPSLNATPDELARYLNRAGFRVEAASGELHFLVLPEPFKKELCKGFNSTNAAKTLVGKGWMLPGDVEGGTQRSTRKHRIPAMGSRPVSVYVLTEAVLGGEE